MIGFFISYKISIFDLKKKYFKSRTYDCCICCNGIAHLMPLSQHSNFFPFMYPFKWSNKRKIHGNGAINEPYSCAIILQRKHLKTNKNQRWKYYHHVLSKCQKDSNVNGVFFRIARFRYDPLKFLTIKHFCFHSTADAAAPPGPLIRAAWRAGSLV